MREEIGQKHALSIDAKSLSLTSGPSGVTYPLNSKPAKALTFWV